jgi:hypothetical protein
VGAEPYQPSFAYQTLSPIEVAAAEEDPFMEKNQ